MHHKYKKRDRLGTLKKIRHLLVTISRLISLLHISNLAFMVLQEEKLLG